MGLKAKHEARSNGSVRNPRLSIALRHRKFRRRFAVEQGLWSVAEEALLHGGA